MLPSEAWNAAMKRKRGTTGRNQFSKARDLGLEVPVVSEETKQKIRESNLGKVWSEDKRSKHSAVMKKVVAKNPDSYSKNNVVGRVKNIEYNGHILKGSWELATAQWLDSLGILWESEVNPQLYFWNGSEHLYFPDFYLPDENIYLEVKGYKRDRDEAKWSSFVGNLVIIDKNVIHQLSKFTVNGLVKTCSYKGSVD